MGEALIVRRGGGVTKFPTGISITTAPTKTSYKAGESISVSGMVVTATFSDDSTQVVTSECTFSPSAGTVVYESTTKITVTWTWSELGVPITYMVNQPITVTRVLSSIAITTKPTKTTYYKEDTLSLSGMVVTATFTSGNTATVTGYTSSPAAGSILSSYGTKTVTVSYTESGVTKTASFTISVTVETVDFSSGTWAQIQNMIQAAIQGVITLSNYWAVGDTKSVTLTTNEVIELQIAGFNHDVYSSDSVTAPVSFVMKNCLNTIYKMNSSDTNSGGYPASAMKTYVENNIYAKLPSDLKSMVAPVKKKWYTTYNSASSLTEGSYSVWLLSEMEVFGSNSYTIGNGEGSKYPIFTTSSSRIKQVNGSNNWWWLGSCLSLDSSTFVLVSSAGNVNGNYASISGGVVVGLCIR